MAGVGFQLKKMFDQKGVFETIKGYIIATFVTVGPTALCVLAIISMQYIMKLLGTTFDQREIFLGCITYAFAFSMIGTGGISMLASRYVADIIFQKKLKDILPSMYGFLFIGLVIAMSTGVIFFSRGNLTQLTTVLALLLYLALTVIWIEMVYISAVKDYLSIAKIFAGGMLLAVVLLIALTKTNLLSVVDSALVAFDSGFFFMIIFFTWKIHAVFGKSKLTLSECFAFLKKIDSYPHMILIGFLYYLGMYGHIFVHWIGNDAINVKGTFIYNPIYDVPVFYAFLTILPLTVLFVVKIETTFYEKYKKYYLMVAGHGSIKDIKNSKDEMMLSLNSEIKFAMEFQLFISFAAILVGIRMLPKLGLSMVSVDIFVILVFGCYCFAIMYLIVLILLYFEDRAGVMSICFIFSSTSIVFSIIAKVNGERSWGYGFFYASFLTLAIALIRLNSFLKDLEYRTFAAQPVYASEKTGIFNKTYHLIFGKKNSKT